MADHGRSNTRRAQGNDYRARGRCTSASFTGVVGRARRSIVWTGIGASRALAGAFVMFVLRVPCMASSGHEAGVMLIVSVALGTGS